MGAYLRFMIGLFIMYLIPIVTIVLFSRPIRNHLMKHNIQVKVADLLVPFLLVGIHLFSMQSLNVSYFPYLLLFIFGFGIILSIYIYIQKKEFYIRTFFHIWWRFVFIFSFVLFYILGGNLIYSLFSV